MVDFKNSKLRHLQNTLGLSKKVILWLLCRALRPIRNWKSSPPLFQRFFWENTKVGFLVALWDLLAEAQQLYGAKVTKDFLASGQRPAVKKGQDMAIHYFPCSKDFSKKGFNFHFLFASINILVEL